MTLSSTSSWFYSTTRPSSTSLRAQSTSTLTILRVNLQRTSAGLQPSKTL